MAFLLRVSYKDPMDGPREAPWETCPYTKKKAEALVPVLKRLGCTDIKLVPADRGRKGLTTA